MINKKVLVVYYSRSGVTRKVSKNIGEMLKCDVEELTDTKNRDGIWGFIISGKDAMFKKPAVIERIDMDSSQYDLVLIGTPVWAGNMSCAIRTYINDNKDKFNNVGFFCTSGGSKSDVVIENMEKLCSKKSIANVTLSQKAIKDDTYLQSVKDFVAEITEKVEKA